MQEAFFSPETFDLCDALIKRQLIAEMVFSILPYSSLLHIVLYSSSSLSLSLFYGVCLCEKPALYDMVSLTAGTHACNVMKPPDTIWSFINGGIKNGYVINKQAEFIH